MSRILSILSVHRGALLAALVVALVHGVFHPVASRAVDPARGTYEPVAMAGHFDEGYYAIRAAAAYRGDLLVGDTHVRESGETPAFLPIANPLVLAALGRIAGSMRGGFVLADFVLPALAFLILYGFVYDWTRGRTKALFFSCLFVLAPHVGLLPAPEWFPFDGDTRELFFSRFDYPSVTFPFLALAFWMAFRLVRDPRRATACAAGLAGGFLFYTYFYDWAYFAVLGALLMLGALLAREWRLARFLALAGGVFALVSLPYWWNLYQLATLPGYADLVTRIGVERSHRFRFDIVWFSYLRALFLAGAIFLTYRRRDRATALFFAASVLPIIILLNVQVITGFVPQPDHWHRTQFLPLALAWFAVILAFLVPLASRFSRSYRAFGIGLAIALVLVSFQSTYRAALATAPLLTRPPTTTRLIAWIVASTSPDAVFGSLAGELDDTIVFETGRRVYLPNGLLSVVSTDEIWARARALARLYGISGDAYRTFLGDETLYLFADAYRDHSFGSYFRSTPRLIPPDLVRAEQVRYEATLPSSESSFALDYLVLSAYERGLGGRAPRGFAPVYTDGDLVVYQTHP